MSKDKNLHDKNEEMQNNETDVEDTVEQNAESNGDSECDDAFLEEDVDQLMVKLDEKSKKCEEYMGMLQRTVAEFDNYKKRTAKEKCAIYENALSDVVEAFLPVIDNIERAVQASNEESDSNTLKEGIDLIYKQFKEVLDKLEVTEIESVGCTFDPNQHNAVMHVEDDSYDESTIVEELQKGYRCKDKIIRYSMVKVAN
ncbi:nucleotide exchange factor GrpE [Herbivorax sp. ANBcel31]|uniref:nucleotide exchange factor GrpE n=1 Tax=Herbivorax sp. ANBcel31 TaxID=3069754 RepID=UPI0027B6C839|nr:nucleotide exchange factor GrpE [Herbivorax sp. ANBcel31]MDQ2084987.1 nucleotide exchange factor GrpE [Herbivorax sp. ANBcel31]